MRFDNVDLTQDLSSNATSLGLWGQVASNGTKYSALASPQSSIKSSNEANTHNGSNRKNSKSQSHGKMDVMVRISERCSAKCS